MKLLKWIGVLVTLAGLAALIVVVAPSVYGQSAGRLLDAQGPRGRELRVLSGRGAEIGVRVADAAEGGARIEDVQGGTPAEKAGLKRDDVIVEFDGEHVRSARQFARLVQETPVGRTVKATVIREGQRKEVQIATTEGRTSSVIIDGDRLRERFGDLGNLRDYVRPFNFDFDLDIPGMMSGRRLGVTIEELTDQLAQYFGVKEGVMVTSVGDGSAAAHAGIKAGDVITSINGQRVAAREDLLRGLRDAVREAPESSNEADVKLGIVRDKKEMAVTAKIEAPRRTVRRGRPA